MWCQEMVRTVCSGALGYQNEQKRDHCYAMFTKSCLFFVKRHDECIFSGISTCECGPLKDHILPPWAIYAVSKVK